jgi:Protein of unknown function (DUF3300)
MATQHRFLRPLVAAMYLCVSFFSILPPPAQASAEEDLDKLMAPIALYPDALLAQTLTAATSPDQVPEFHKWLGEQKATGSDLQQAAQDAKFDAAFASLAVFPDVIKLLAENMDWTKAIGASYQSDKKAVEASIQRLRAQAKEKGNLESNEQQSVKVESSGSTQTIIIEPANPQVVYVPVYDPVVVYQEPAPAGGMLLAFGIGIAIGASMSNPYYGYGAWGYGWGGGGCYYHHGPYMPPPYARYPYPPPVHGYRPPSNVYAPRNTNVNINVDNSRTNVGNQVNSGNRGDVNTGSGNRGGNQAGTNNRGTGGSATQPSAGNRAAQPSAGNAAQPSAGNRAAQPSTSNRAATSPSKGAEPRGRSSSGVSNPSGSKSSAMGGYSNGASAQQASSRGRSSTSASHGGGSRSGGGASRGGGGGRR